MKKLVMVAAALVYLIAPATARTVRNGNFQVDGNMLLALCGPNAYPADLPYCYGFLLGTANTMRALDDGFRSCMPAYNAIQLRDVVVRVLRNRPEIRHLGGAELASQAIQDAWNCPLERQAPAAARAVQSGRALHYKMTSGCETSNVTHPQGRQASRPAVVQSTKIEVLINAETARMLNLTIPPSLLAAPSPCA
jgi:Rap1a immunity proteins